MVELRKRKTPPPAPVKPAKKAATKPKAPAADKKAAPAKAETKTEKAAPPKAKAGSVTVGEKIELDGFGGEVETNDGEKTTLKKLVEQSKGGVVLFTYPKASTPGCTTQACMFRDGYKELTATGLAIYGLSRDSPKANTSFKNRQQLTYPLLCDPTASLIGAIGLKNGDKTARGVFVVTKEGKVLAAQPGSPGATVKVVEDLVGKDGKADSA